MNPAIADFAFKRKNYTGIEYLKKWYRADYFDQLNKYYLECLDSAYHESYFKVISISKALTELLDLNDDETLEKAAYWFQDNRDKWEGISGIDDLLDKSYIIWEIIGEGQERYPFNKKSVEFLLGKWKYISGFYPENYDDDIFADTIVFEPSLNEDSTDIIEFVLSNDSILLFRYNNKYKRQETQNLIYNSKHNWLIFNSTSYFKTGWYLIKEEENSSLLP